MRNYLIVILLTISACAAIGKYVTDNALTKQKTALTEDFNSEKQGWLDTFQHAKDRYIQQLRDANAQLIAAQQKEQTLSAQFLAYQEQAAKKAADLKRRLNDALSHDGAAFTGIGPDGLRLYRDALGYTTTPPGAGQRLPAATGVDVANPPHASTARAGLSPSGLITHAAEYGAWCQQLREQLYSLNQFYGGTE
ncbi:hypothetical protein VYN02_001039 [Shigella sonnei]|nr:hypothetical protein [Shigella sonnei]EKY7370472.1 hypothetical protein [Shigella sonnei]EME4986207.1 hypothetical protein [Shigella sonnei]